MHLYPFVRQTNLTIGVFRLLHAVRQLFIGTLKPQSNGALYIPLTLWS